MTTPATENKIEKVTKEPYRRDLNLNIIASFRPGSKVHGRRLEVVQEAMEEALAKVVQEQLPNAKVDVQSTMEWRYVFKEDSKVFAMGVPVDEDGNEIPEEEPEETTEEE